MAKKSRFKNDKQYKVSPRKYNVEQKEGETELQYYHRLAKAADQRMRRLEALNGQEGYKNILRYSYSSAAKDMEKYGGRRWDKKPPEIRQLYVEKIMDMRRFLESPTSTKYGIQEVYQQRANTINQKYGTDFTWQDLADYFGKGQADKLAKDGYGSKTALYAIGMIKSTQKKLVDGIKSNANVTMEGPVTDAALAILRKKNPIAGLKLTAEEKKNVREAIKGKNKKKTRKTNA